MFSGLIETTGRINMVDENQQMKRLFIYAPSLTEDMAIGHSIAVNGVCLTVVEFDLKGFWVQVVPETLRCTTLANCHIDDEVNLERAMRLDQRVGGHVVQGHVDGVATIFSIQEEGEAWLVDFSLDSKLQNYIVNKGFITIDGMSITVIAASEHQFSVTLIPHTRAVTIAKHYHVGQRVNIEVDMMGKYIVQFLERQHATN